MRDFDSAEQHDELVASYSANGIRCAQSFFEPTCDLFEQYITGIMAVQNAADVRCSAN